METFEIFEFFVIIHFFKIFRKYNKQAWKFLKDEKMLLMASRSEIFQGLGILEENKQTKKQKKNYYMSAALAS